MPFAANRPTWIEADPAGARQIDFGPGMQIGEVFDGTAGRRVA